MSKRNKYSEFFDITKNGLTAKCKTCLKTFQCPDRATSGLKYHVEKVHNFTTDDTKPQPDEKKPKINPIMANFVQKKKPTLEEIISKEASSKGASFKYLAESDLIRRGISTYGYNAPKSSNTVRRLVHKSAENHRKIYREKFKNLIEKDERFCLITDEWTCPPKKRKYLNVTLHLKGKHKQHLYNSSYICMVGCTMLYITYHKSFMIHNI